MPSRLDENHDFLLDHIGLRLWRAHRSWQAAYARSMREAGYYWFTESRALLLGQIPRSGVRQALLHERMGMSKQAVQQLLDGLVREGIVERRGDPADGRVRMVRFTAKGMAVLEHGDGIKFHIEKRYMERLGQDRFAALMKALDLVGGDP